MLLDVVITSHHRTEKLYKLLMSLGRCVLNNGLWDSVSFHIKITDINDKIDLLDGRYQLPEIVMSRTKFYMIGEKFRAPSVWNHHLGYMKADVMVYLTDDIEVAEDFLQQIMLQTAIYMPDYDGVIGFNQTNLEGVVRVCKAAFGAVGRVFAERFPDKQVFCPDYGHLYIDTELEAAAKHAGRFWWCSEIQLVHYHPAVNPDWYDATHEHIRNMYKAEDIRMWNARKVRNWIWGINFNRLHGVEV